MKKYSRIRADIDLDAVLYNFENMKANIRPGCKITAVIKADGYGHGSVQIAELMEPYDYMWGFAVAAADEAFRLRRAGIRKPIMLLGYTFDEFYEDLIREDVRICVFDYDTAVRVSDAAFTAKRKLLSTLLSIPV